MIKTDCIDACLACIVTCETCMTDCVKEGNQACILLCRDCADICALCAKFEARSSPFAFELHTYVLKFVLHVPMNALNMHNTIKVAKLVLRLVKNALTFVLNIQPNLLIK